MMWVQKIRPLGAIQGAFLFVVLGASSGGRMRLKRSELIVLIVGGILLPMLVWGWQKWIDAKSLSIAVIAESQMVVTGADKVPEVQIAVNGTALDSPYVSYIRVANNGGQPLTADDFKTPISLRLKSSSKLEHLRVIAQSPSDLNLQVVRTANGLSFKPELLNKGDTFQILVVTTGEKPLFDADGRLVGVSELNVIGRSENRLSDLWPYLEFLAFALLVSCSLHLIPNGANQSMLLTIRARLFVGFCTMISAMVFGITAAFSHGIRHPDEAMNFYWAACAVSYVFYRLLKKYFYPVDSVQL